MTNKNYRKFTFEVLKAIALAGAVAAVILLPSLAAVFAPLVEKSEKGDRKKVARNKALQTIWRLKRSGLIKNTPDGKLFLTEKGKRAFADLQFKKVEIKRPKRWDGKWRMVAFDVWETRRSTRDILRKILVNVGFVKLQNSLWIYPYECAEIVELLRTHLRLSPAIYYITVESIDRDQWLRKHFGL